VDATDVTGFINDIPATIDDSALSGTITLASGENVVTVTCQDAAGNTANSRLTLYLDTEPLSITAIDPIYGASDVALTTAVTVSFSEPVNPAILDSSTFFIHDGGAIVPADLAVSSDALTVVLTPSVTLLPGATIDVILTAGIYRGKIDRTGRKGRHHV